MTVKNTFESNNIEEIKAAIVDALESLFKEHEVFVPELRARARRKTYSVSDAAMALGVSKTSMWNAVRHGSIPSFRVGRRVLVSASTIDALLNVVPTNQELEVEND